MAEAPLSSMPSVNQLKLEKELGPSPIMKTDTSSIIILSGLPQVNESKLSALSNSLKKLYQEFGTIDYIYIPVDSLSKNLKGYAFIDFDCDLSAFAAISALPKYQLDSKHCLQAISYNFFVKLQRKMTNNSQNDIGISELEQKEISFTSHDYSLLRGWAHDPKIDNILMTMNYSQKINLFVNITEKEDLKGSLSLSPNEKFMYSRQMWSPQGSYLIVTNRSSVMVYVTSNDKELQFSLHKKFEIEGEILDAKISHCERYLLVQSSLESLQHSTLICIPAKIVVTEFNQNPITVGNMEFSPCGNYLAFISAPHTFVILITESGKMLADKPQHVADVFKFKWSTAPIRNYSQGIGIAIYCLPNESEKVLASLVVYL
ncbi:MAG: translation initiation factor eIF-3b like protein, partial [Paramarteilia canceri]